MRVLAIGLSAIITKRLMPAFAETAAVSGVDVASRSKPAPVSWPKRGAFFTSYEEALQRSRTDLTYISLPNSDHKKWILASLAAGKHVIVDKPAALTLADTQECVDAARKANRLLAEATVFSFHPHIDAMREMMRNAGGARYLDAQFIVPPMPPENFRNSRGLGGGSLLDMGPYAAATARLFTGAPLVSLAAVRAPANPRFDVDMGFSFLAGFADGLRYSGHFGFDGEYQNRLLCVAKMASILSERIFSLPAKMPMQWQARDANSPADQEFAPSDSFANFLAAVAAAITQGEYSGFATDMLADAAFRHRLAAALNDEM